MTKPEKQKDNAKQTEKQAVNLDDLGEATLGKGTPSGGKPKGK